MTRETRPERRWTLFKHPTDGWQVLGWWNAPDVRAGGMETVEVVPASPVSGDAVEAVARALEAADMDAAGIALYRHMARAAIAAYEATRPDGELREALEAIAQQHHDTITPSRLHDPCHIESFADCPAKTCQYAREVLAALSVPVQAQPDGEER